jgi:Helix-turn-helix domain
MSYKIANFIASLRSLTPSEKAVAFVIANHAGHDGRNAYPSMSTVAKEAGLKHRQSASKIVQRLLEKPTEEEAGLLVLESEGTGRGNTNRYRVNLEFSDSKPPAQEEIKCNRGAALSGGTKCNSGFAKCNPDSPESATLDTESATGDCTKGLKGKRERKHTKKSEHLKTRVPLSDEETNPDSYGKPSCPNPVLISGTADSVRPEDVQTVIDKIADVTQSEVIFRDAHKPAIAEMLRAVTVSEFVAVFMAFYKDKCSDFTYRTRFAAADFIAEGPQRIRTFIQSREKSKRLQAEAEAAIAKLRAEDERKRAASEAAAAQEALDMESLLRELETSESDRVTLP